MYIRTCDSQTVNEAVVALPLDTRPDCISNVISKAFAEIAAADAAKPTMQVVRT